MRTAFTEGERTAGAAGMHGEAILQNILKLAGVKTDQKMKKAQINANPGLDGTMVSLGKDTPASNPSPAQTYFLPSHSSHLLHVPPVGNR